MNCPECANELPDASLSCGGCGQLIHASVLEGFAGRAKEAWRLGHFAEERDLWTQSLALLPEETVQHRTISSRIAEINQMLPPAEDSQGKWKKATVTGIGPAVVVLLTKGKFLLLGLTKIGTLLTMFASIGVYWAMYGWPLALGLVVSIYIHEMGHVEMIRRFGFAASAPMFIPGLGAFISLRSVNLPPVPDSRIGLAGPVYGLGASVAALGIYYATGIKIWGVIAHFGAWINLFNLIPVWQLDGSRGVRSLTRYQRGLVLIAAGLLWAFVSVPMLLLVALGCVYRMFTRDWQSEPDNQGMLQFVGLLVALSAVAAVTASVSTIATTH